MKTIEELKQYLIATLPNEHIYLFGSRAKNSASIYSDIDIAIEGQNPLKAILSNVRFHIEESNLPYKVDIVDLAQAPYLKNIVYHEGIVWH